MLDASQPCKESESVDLQINTTSLHDGVGAENSIEPAVRGERGRRQATLR